MTFEKGYKPWNKGLIKETNESLKKMALNKIGKPTWNIGLVGVNYLQHYPNGMNNGFKKGQIPWNKNIKGIHLSPKTEFKKGYFSPRKGSPLSKKTKEKLSNSLKGKTPWNKGITWEKKGSRLNKHWNWRGGTSFTVRAFRGYEWQKIRKQVLERDKETCVKCQNFGRVVDHIIPWRETQDNSLENLQTLCRSCHSLKTWSEGYI